MVFSTETHMEPDKATGTEVERRLYWVHDLVLDSRSGWFVQGAKGVPTEMVVLPPALVCSEVTAGMSSNHGSHTTLYGHVRLPDVASVEVDFSGGQTVKDQTSDGLVAATVPSRDKPTELRVYDDKGQQLHSVKLPERVNPSGQPLCSP